MIQLKIHDESKKLAFQFVLKNAEYRKRCLYLQEIIAMGRRDDTWRRALLAFFDMPVTGSDFRLPCKN
jgi:hypothetical protein